MKEYLMAEKADIVCLQETKLNKEAPDTLPVSEYPYSYFHLGRLTIIVQSMKK